MCSMGWVAVMALRPDRKSNWWSAPASAGRRCRSTYCRQRKSGGEFPPPLLLSLEKLRLRFERGVHFAEGGVEVAAEVGHGSDRGDGDQSGDQAVFDGGGALFVAEASLLMNFMSSPPGSVFGTRVRSLGQSGQLRVKWLAV